MLGFGKDIMNYLEKSLDEMERYNTRKPSSKRDFVITEEEKMCLGIQEEMLRSLENGYKVMGEINLELSELGFEEDCRELEEYEESIMGSGEL